MQNPSENSSVPQINSNLQGQANDNAANIAARSMYQTHQTGKYNFMTPMILSDLHQISSIQQQTGTGSSASYEEQQIQQIEEVKDIRTDVQTYRQLASPRLSNKHSNMVFRSGAISNTRRKSPIDINAGNDSKLSTRFMVAQNSNQGSQWFRTRQGFNKQ